MKRDMDLIRNILLLAEDAQDTVGIDDLIVLNDNRKTIGFHVELMVAHGLVSGNVEYSGTGSCVVADVNNLTWDGYDYLDSIRSPKVWKRAKQAISETVGDTSLSVIKQVCCTITAQLVQAYLG
jgi:hypothetical protein